ncbi:hypothetical protein [Synechococcus sp. Cruz CV12-2-Slac-r]|uniref:hypothetical protein n=1 Tax=Synechococcus sp. Cruz CV12-2-Slac-r TaxID=2823748 RepID=UPI0020CFDF40|nr:hypothetical protein [Synechococcus sp. Cruz CV12-2-Slac-r]MCP9939916.1 hypothetical protein [Synechococcus sp. Cruz CV12-2-Slac-r]
MAIVAIALILMGVFSVDNISYKTGDYLAFTDNNKAGLLEQKSHLAKLLKRDRKGYERSEIKTIAKGQPDPMKIRMGLYAINNYNINLQSPSFESSGYWWLKWGDDLQAYLTENNLKIWKVLTPVNLINIPQYADSVFIPTGNGKPTLMPDGSWYLTGAYSGEFFIDRSDFRRHPFTTLSLPIMIEADDVMLNSSKLEISPDTQGSGIGQFIDSNLGWINQGWTLASYKHHYDSDFGFGKGASDFSQLIFEVKYSTSSWLSFWKILVPLMIVVAMIAGATKLETAHYDVRLTLPVTVLLTLVFMQQTHDANLPQLPYLTFLDEVYVVSYILTLGSFVMMLWACRRYYAALKIEDYAVRELELKKLDKSDDYWPTYVIGIGMIALVICWFTG